MTIPEMLALVRDGGMVVMLLVAVVGGAKRWYVWGWAYEEKCAECAGWKAIALKGLTIADRIVP